MAATKAEKWVSAPDAPDEKVRAATGKGWDEWRAIIDAWNGREKGHTAIAAWLVDEHGVDGWWAQSVTVGYERITGMRLKGQMPDGTFTVGTTRTAAVDAAQLREELLDDERRAKLFPGLDTELRSKPTSKNVRLRMGDAGSAELSFTPKADGRTTIVVQHGKLPSPEAMEAWKSFWAEWIGKRGA